MARASLASFVFGCLVALAASVLRGPSAARACSGPSCAKTALLPPDGGSVPANGVELIWRRSVIFAGDAGTELHLYELDGGTRRELSFTLTNVPGDDTGLQKIIPREQLAAGTEVEVEVEEVCAAEHTSVTSSFRVGPAAPAPSSLGWLEMEGYRQDPLELRVQNGACYLPYKVSSVRLWIALSEAARPYADLLRYELHVDGKLYTTEEAQPNWREQPPQPIGGSALGRGMDRIYRVCETGLPSAFFSAPPPTGLPEGKHRLQMFALMPDGTRLATAEIEVFLNCPTPVDYWRPSPSSPVDHWEPNSSGLGATELATSAAGQTSGRAPDTARDAASATVLDGSTMDLIPADPSSQPSARRGSVQCSPLIGTRTGRPLLGVLFVLLISIVAGRTKRRLHALGSMRQSGRDGGAERPPHL